MAQIHPSAVVDSHAELDDSVIVGPFCLIGPNVKIGAGTHLRNHVSIEGRTTIGARNVIYAGAAIGCHPQDKKYAGEDTVLIVGDDNVIRENCTFSIGTIQDKGTTRVGSRNLFMANAHVAHDCCVGNDTILANNVALGGHVVVEDFAIIGGQSGVHQFVRVGAHAMVGGLSAVLRDVPPYVICAGNPAEPHGLNSIGLRRCDFDDEAMSALKQCYRVLYREKNIVKEALELMAQIAAQHPSCKEAVEHFMNFVASSPRGIIR